MKFERVGITNKLTEKAMRVYFETSFVFWKKGNTYYYSDNGKSEKVELGTLKDVNEFLESLSLED